MNPSKYANSCFQIIRSASDGLVGVDNLFCSVVDYKGKGMKLMVRVGDQWGHQREGSRKILKGYRPQRRVIQVGLFLFSKLPILVTRAFIIDKRFLLF